MIRQAVLMAFTLLFAAAGIIASPQLSGSRRQFPVRPGVASMVRVTSPQLLGSLLPPLQSGPDTLIRLDAGGQPLVARVHGIPDLRPGDPVGVKLDRRQLHLFDAAGARLR